MFCSKCGIETPPDAQFCHKCGKPLVSHTPPAKPEDDAPEVSYNQSDEPRPYVPPGGAQLDGVKGKIVEVGRMTDIFVTNNLKLLFERTVFPRGVPKTLAFVQGTSENEAQSIRAAFDPSKPDFIPIAATCCTAYLLGRTRELSPRKWMFVELFRGLLDDKISELKIQFPDLPAILSYAAYAACYARYLEHNGKVGLLSTPYLGYLRSLNRSLTSEAYRFRAEIEENYNGKNHILAMLYGLDNRNCFVRISDNPDVFKIYPMVVDWFTRNVPLAETDAR